MKADYPLVQKAMMKSMSLLFKRQCASGAAQISYTWSLEECPEVEIVFADSLTHLQGSLEGLLKAYKCKVMKGDVDHSLININTLWTEIPRQRIEDYQRGDTDGLYELLIKYDSVVQQQLGWSWINNGILTSASLAEKSYFGMHYREMECPIYRLTAEDSDYCRAAYAGGLVDCFHKGYHPRVVALDVNSSYPSSMIPALPVGPYHKVLLNRYHAGEPLQQGIYRVTVTYTPQLQYPSIGLKRDGKYVFARLENQTVSVTSEEVSYAFSLGYRLFLLDAVVSMRSERIYDSFIGGGYLRRVAAKKAMKLLGKADITA